MRCKASGSCLALIYSPTLAEDSQETSSKPPTEEGGVHTRPLRFLFKNENSNRIQMMFDSLPLLLISRGTKNINVFNPDLRDL